MKCLKLTQAALSISVLFCLSTGAGWCEANYDQGLKYFQQRNFPAASKSFEKAIESAPWESSSYYYCALSYHHGKDFKKAAERYGDVVEKFPGTAACQQAIAALNVLDPGFFKKKEHQKALAAAAAARAAATGPVSSGSGSTAKDKGTVEGEAQTRAYFSKQGSDMIVDLRVGGRAIRANLDPHSAETGFSRSQLQALGVQVGAAQKEARCDIQLGGAVRRNFPVTVDDNVGTEPKIGSSFLDAFIYQIDEKANCIALTRKGGTGGGAAGGSSAGPQVSFQKDGRDIIVNVEINSRNAPMVFDPNGDGLVMPPRIAKSVGLRVDEAEEQKPSLTEGPQRGEPGWVPPDERPSGPKTLTISRLRFGPVDKQAVSCQITEKESKYGRCGADICSGWKFDIDYQANVIRFTKK